MPMGGQCIISFLSVGDEKEGKLSLKSPQWVGCRH